MSCRQNLAFGTDGIRVCVCDSLKRNVCMGVRSVLNFSLFSALCSLNNFLVSSNTARELKNVFCSLSVGGGSMCVSLCACDIAESTHMYIHVQICVHVNIFVEFFCTSWHMNTASIIRTHTKTPTHTAMLKCQNTRRMFRTIFCSENICLDYVAAIFSLQEKFTISKDMWIPCEFCYWLRQQQQWQQQQQRAMTC